MTTYFYMQTTSGDVFRTTMPGYHKECKVLGKKEGEAIYKKQTGDDLRKWLKPGATVYCVLRSVSSSGMSRRISLFAVRKGELVSLDYLAATLTGRTLSDKGGIVCNGCGMDMGFDLVYALGCAAWPKCTRKPHGTRNGQPDSNGGYALKSSWI